MTKTFADDPARYFNSDAKAAHGISRTEQDGLQLEAAQSRFAVMRNALPPLKALADGQGIDTIDNLEALPAVLFPHSLYKAYPEHLVVEFDFPKLTKWLSRLTLNDLSAVEGREFETLDDWQDAIDNETEVNMVHSSGTMGKLSFYPRGKKEIELQKDHARMSMAMWAEPEHYDFDEPGFSIIWPSYAGGRSALLQFPKAYRETFAKSPDHFHASIPMSMSTDYQYYLIQANAHKENGSNLTPEPTPRVREMIDKSVQLRDTHQQRLDEMLDLIEKDWRTDKTLLVGGPLNIYELAKAGLDRGMEQALGPGSVVRTFGGLKGLPAPDDLNDAILQFSGVSDIKYCYGMTELTAALEKCSNGRFHCHPWIFIAVLDPLTGRPKPRKGVQEGRGAFFDLVAQTYWGGVITADHIEIDWTPCSCGRTTPHVSDGIIRVEDGEREHYIGPAPEAAIDAALAALNEGLG